MERYDAEIVSLGKRIMKYCPDQTIRLEATARLAFQHCEMGRKKLGRMLYETLPSQETCRENQIWWALEEDEKLSFLRKNATAFDTRAETQSFSSLLLGEITVKRTNFDTVDTRPLCKYYMFYSCHPLYLIQFLFFN